MEGNTQNLRRKMELLQHLNASEAQDAEAFKRRLDVLKEVALTLLEELESLDHVRSINLRRGINLYDEMRKFEINLIQTALERTGGHQTRAAQLLGVNLTTLHNKLKRLNISPNVEVSAPVVYEDAVPPATAAARESDLASDAEAHPRRDAEDRLEQSLVSVAGD